jgi:hypothetical protein
LQNCRIAEFQHQGRRSTLGGGHEILKFLQF